MDGERHNDTENSEVPKNVQVDHSAESCVGSDRMTGVEDAAQSDIPKDESNAKTCQLESTEKEKPDVKTSEKSDDKHNHTPNSTGSGLSEAVVKISKPLCANYRSDSDSDSLDSESDTSTTTDEGTSETFSESEDEHDTSHDKREKQEERKAQKDLSLSDLPPIEDLKISVPENACVEVGKISGIVDTLVVVESYKGTAALDVDTVLFLDCGKRTLGKIFDVLGPITEPVYTVRFNNQDQIKSLNVEKEQKVYYAPKTQHTMFVFLSEVLKNKGSDASWKDNVEAPSEFQDFSDDEKERQHRDKQRKDCDGDNPCGKDATHSRKRSFSRTKQTSGVLQQPRFRHPGLTPQRRPNPPRNLPPTHFAPPPSYPTPIPPLTNQPPIFPYNVPPYPGTNYFATAPQVYYPPRFSGPAFPPFGGHPPFAQRGFHHPFFQQRSHSYRQPVGGMWTAPMFRPPPPPPPPPDGQSQQQEHPDGKQT